MTGSCTAGPLPATNRIDGTKAGGTSGRLTSGDLVAEGLSFAYPQRGFLRKSPGHALKDITLRLSPGSSTALVGRSGSGKSTLVRIMLALTRPSSGTVSLGPRPVQPGSAKALRWYRRSVQYVPQNPAGSLDPRMTVAQLLTEPLRQLRVDGSHRLLVAQALERVEVAAALLDRRPGELSGGQNQRVAVARALVASPSYLLADEPVSGLDLPLRDTVLALLDNLVRHDGLGLLLVTHDLAAAATMCGTTAVLDDGRIVEHGPTHQILNDPRNQATAALLEASPGLLPTHP